MSGFVAERLNLVEPSPTLAITALANKLKAEGKDVVGFGAGEPDFDTPVFIKEAAKKALDEGFTKYTPVSGIPDLKAAIVAKFKRDNNLEYDVSQIIVSTGGKQVLYNLFLSVINAGDEVIIPAPYWVSYKDIVMLADGTTKIIQCPIEQKYKITPEQLENAITEKTKVFLMNSPSNPTGSTYTEDELRALAKVLEKHPQILVVSDDIYEHLLYDEHKFSNLAMVSKDLFERTVVVNGLSKAYSMTGWRLGYAACKDKEIIKAMDTIQGQSTSNANSFAQKGAVAALNGDQSCIDEMKKSFVERRNYLFERLNKIQGLKVMLPEGAFYIYPDFSNLVQSDGFKKLAAANPTEISVSKIISSALLSEYSVAVVPGIAFGYDPSFRMSYATSMKQIEKGMDRIEEFFQKLAL
ncbi:MAG: pyridoxal phosphate-dependent aminotransferase [Leptospiraceae bacterium]|nr:pyridoxal phosphate-dependent aminotransferase [Leptospiraceae bacterium]